MTLLIPPHRFNDTTDWEQARPLIDDNFDKTVQAIIDLGAKTTSSTQIITSSIAAGDVFHQTVAIVNPDGTSTYPYITLPKEESGLTSVIPAMDIRVDTDAPLYLWPNGNSLSTGQRKLTITAKVDLTTVDGIGSLTISGRNNDSSAHVYYITIRVAYFPLLAATAFR